MPGEASIELFIHIYVGLILMCTVLPYTHLLYIVIMDGCYRKRRRTKLAKYSKNNPALSHLRNKLIHSGQKDLQLSSSQLNHSLDNFNKNSNSLISSYDGYDEL